VIRLRLEQKTGGPMRKVLARYFDAAREAGRLDDYRVFARMEIERILAMCVFNGLPEHARTTVRQFRELFKWHQRSGVYLLTVFPGATSAVLRFAAYMGQVLHLERQASRRRLYPKRSAKKADG